MNVLHSGYSNYCPSRILAEIKELPKWNEFTEIAFLTLNMHMKEREMQNFAKILKTLCVCVSYLNKNFNSIYFRFSFHFVLSFCLVCVSDCFRYDFWFPQQYGREEKNITKPKFSIKVETKNKMKLNFLLTHRKHLRFPPHFLVSLVFYYIFVCLMEWFLRSTNVVITNTSSYQMLQANQIKYNNKMKQ